MESCESWTPRDRLPTLPESHCGVPCGDGCDDCAVGGDEADVGDYCCCCYCCYTVAFSEDGPFQNADVWLPCHRHHVSCHWRCHSAVTEVS